MDKLLEKIDRTHEHVEQEVRLYNLYIHCLHVHYLLYACDEEEARASAARHFMHHAENRIPRTEKTAFERTLEILIRDQRVVTDAFEVYPAEDSAKSGVIVTSSLDPL